MRKYERPAIREIGTVQELTLGTFNKVGVASDVFTQLTNGAVIGSLVASP